MRSFVLGIVVVAAAACSQPTKRATPPAGDMPDAGHDHVDAGIEQVDAIEVAVVHEPRPPDEDGTIDITYLRRVAKEPAVECVDHGARDTFLRTSSPLGSVEVGPMTFRQGCTSAVLLQQFLADHHPETVQCFEAGGPGRDAGITLRTVWGDVDRRYQSPDRFTRSTLLHAMGDAGIDVAAIQRCLDGVLAQYRRFSSSETPVVIDFAMIRFRTLPPGRVGGSSGRPRL